MDEDRSVDKTNNRTRLVIGPLVTFWGIVIGVIGVIVPLVFRDIQKDFTIYCSLLGVILAFFPIYQAKSKLQAELQRLKDQHSQKQSVIDSAYSNNLLSNVITIALNASKLESVDGGRSKKKIEHFLLEISQVDRLNPLKLKLDDKKYDNLYQTKGTLSITDAPIFAWKNPEYNWFLLSNYTSVLLKRLEKSTNKRIQLVSRKNNLFKSFINEGNELLKKIKEGSFDFQNSIRFYLLTKEEIERNKAMIGQMVAGHDLFGIHLFIVNKDILSDIGIESFYNQLKNEAIVSNNVIDLMIFKNNKDELRVKYPDSNTGELKEIDYKDDVLLDCDPFLKKLASFILSDDKKYLLYPRATQKDVPFSLNKNKTHLAVS